MLSTDGNTVTALHPVNRIPCVKAVDLCSDIFSVLVKDWSQFSCVHAVPYKNVSLLWAVQNMYRPNEG